MHHPVSEPLYSHIVTVHSDGENASDFVAPFPQTLSFPAGLYNVGLLELHCFKTEATAAAAEPETENEEETTEEVNSTALSTVSPLFPNIIAPTVGSHNFTFQKKTNLMEFMMDFNFAMVKASVPITFAAYYPSLSDDDNAVFELNVKITTENTYLLLPMPIATACGFKRCIFPPGVYTSQRSVTFETLSSILKHGEVYHVKTISLQNNDNVITIHEAYESEIVITYSGGT